MVLAISMVPFQPSKGELESDPKLQGKQEYFQETYNVTKVNSCQIIKMGKYYFL